MSTVTGARVGLGFHIAPEKRFPVIEGERPFCFICPPDFRRRAQFLNMSSFRRPLCAIHAVQTFEEQQNHRARYED